MGTWNSGFILRLGIRGRLSLLMGLVLVLRVFLWFPWLPPPLLKTNFPLSDFTMEKWTKEPFLLLLL